ncbi:3-isopropylmalate dehydratase small subunit 1 [Pseudomonas fluorescens]|uniref:3-isopropylmalate dehydratase small subunit n=1 Tax=Pseudomonas fluorescens TaxID=294 RepID=A0A8H2NMQ1_PSEFL|nr:3-isopropylmalate dehydratase small subunit [Pseudomonas fluorescens]VVO58435.1 3-isopropylmalate dehydratase small subunit 1 [Pseudomonas fluorescens]
MMPFVALDGLVAPVDRANIDTDAILPKQFMTSISRTGFGPNLFDEHRYLDRGEPGQDASRRVINPGFSLNQPRYSGASILLTRRNFGCGSSREHAPWALIDYGFRAIIAPSFADIFYGNCFKNGLLPVCLPESVIDILFDAVDQTPGYRLDIDLVSQTVTDSHGEAWSFEVDAARKESLINGLDDIAITLTKADKIHRYEEIRRTQEPWLF